MDRPKRQLGVEPQTPPPMYSSVVGPSTKEYTLVPGGQKISTIVEAPSATAPYPDKPVVGFAPYPVSVPTAHRSTSYLPHTVRREYQRPFPDRVCVPDTYGFASDVIGVRRPSLEKARKWNWRVQGNYKEESPMFCVILVCCVLIVLLTLLGVSIQLSKRYGGL
ncbi:uncharacterized protein LOC105691044 [Athalia rosae]|uniref:uncharacterized protein LOC105691044 n=1 Tax=Athalia rosae TaxID=37344 RepID=UPI00203441C0|nr:uncharacterized protein LOC105691044 [Athalia rosae]